MRVALIIDDSYAHMYDQIYHTLKEVCDKYGHTLRSYGKYGEYDKNLSYTHAALLGAILINASACDLVITGCKTGQGAMIALNSFSNVICGFVANSIDAYYFKNMFEGNAVSISFDQGYYSDLNLYYCFENLLSNNIIKQDYTKEVALSKMTKERLGYIKKSIDFIDQLNYINKDFVLETIDRESFKEYFFKDSQNETLNKYLKTLINN